MRISYNKHMTLRSRHQTSYILTHDVIHMRLRSRHQVRPGQGLVDYELSCWTPDHSERALRQFYYMDNSKYAHVL